MLINMDNVSAANDMINFQHHNDRKYERDSFVFIHELTHRFSNELTSIIACVSLAEAKSGRTEVKTAFAHVLDRLRNYALVHDALRMPVTGTSNASDYLRRLCKSISRSRLAEEMIELVFVEHSLELKSERCWLLGMIVSELITNAARHAFTGKGGIIRVELSCSGSKATCCVRDNGTGYGDVALGQGLKIVRALTFRLMGEFSLQSSPTGTISLVEFPIDSQ